MRRAAATAPILSLAATGCGQGAAIPAGVTVHIPFDELPSAAHGYGEHHTAIYGQISGMAVMAAGSIMLL